MDNSEAVLPTLLITLVFVYYHIIRIWYTDKKNIPPAWGVFFELIGIAVWVSQAVYYTLIYLKQ